LASLTSFEESRLSADRRLASRIRPRLSAALAIGALGLGLLATPTGTAVANPATPTQATTSSQRYSLFPEVGSSRYDVKHYAISLRYQSSGDIQAKTTLTAKARKTLRSFSLDLEGLTVDKVLVNARLISPDVITS
jgi:hypothetical protein